MKRNLIVVTLITLAMSLGTMAVILDSPHDLSLGSSGLASTNMIEICGVCHVPHHAQTGAAAIIPLWSHNTGAGPYTAYTLTVTGQIGAIAEESLACVSCHDGVTGIGALYTAGAPDPVVVTGVNTSTSAPAGLAVWTDPNDVMGTDYSNDHPVGVILTDNVDYDLPISARLFPTTVSGSEVECASCHDVHNANNEQATNGWLLRASMDNSALCLDCHNK